MNIHLRMLAPDPSIGHLVQHFWLLENRSGRDVEATILPDGMIDLFFLRPPEQLSRSAQLQLSDKPPISGQPLLLELKGLDTEPSEVIIPAGTRMLAIGFKLPAVEFLFHASIATTLNKAQNADNEFWQFDDADYNDFDRFCEKATAKIKSVVVNDPDTRKVQLFHLLYSSNGALTVKELAEKVFWSPRQMNRYFNQQFGLTLKAYCNILRFRASFEHIKKGKLFPEQNFFDQAHFIKAVKKLSGVVPKELKENKNDRFLQFSVLPKK